MSAFTDDDVTAQDRCRAGLEPHHMVSHHVPNGWIEQCSMCGMFDMTEYDAAIAARADRAETVLTLPPLPVAEWGPPKADRAKQVSSDE